MARAAILDALGSFTGLVTAGLKLPGSVVFAIREILRQGTRRDM